MKNVVTYGWLAIAIFGSVVAQSAADAGKAEKENLLPGWQWRAAVEANEKPSKGLVEFEVTSAVFDGARPDLADLRILAGTDQLPWVLRRPRGTGRTERDECELYNRTNRPGRSDRVTVRFEEEVMKDSLRIMTSGENFKRAVTVEGSPNGAEWELLQDGKFLFDISTEAGGRHRKNRIRLPRNNFRYLRLTVHHDPDDLDKIAIEDVKSYRTVGKPAPVKEVPVVNVLSELDTTENQTIVTVDVGYRNLPLRGMTLDFEEENFHRHATVKGRNHETREIRRRIESGGERTQTVEEPWTTVERTHVYRYTAGTGRDESVEIDLEGAGYRYIRVDIHNEDNAPLTLTDVSADRYLTYAAFQPRGTEHWRLYFGNPGAAKPDYDLAHYADRLRSEGVTPAIVGVRTPWDVEEPDLPPLSEQYREWLWIMLLLAVAVVGWMVWRQAQSATRQTKET